MTPDKYGWVSVVREGPPQKIPGKEHSEYCFVATGGAKRPTVFENVVWSDEWHERLRWWGPDGMPIDFVTHWQFMPHMPPLPEEVRP